jgi:hypothetical protein
MQSAKSNQRAGNDQDIRQKLVSQAAESGRAELVGNANEACDPVVRVAGALARGLSAFLRSGY